MSPMTWRGGSTHRNGQGKGVGGGSGGISPYFRAGMELVHIPPLGQIKQKQVHTALPMMCRGNLTHQTGQGRGVGGGADQLVVVCGGGDFPLFCEWLENCP